VLFVLHEYIITLHQTVLLYNMQKLLISNVFFGVQNNLASPQAIRKAHRVCYKARCIMSVISVHKSLHFNGMIILLVGLW